MKIEIYSNGFKSEWDDQLCVGALITARQPGYHVLTRIEYPDSAATLKTFDVRLIEGEAAPIFHYVKVLNEDGTEPKSKKELSCHAAWCREVTAEAVRLLRLQEQARLDTKFANLAKFVGSQSAAA